MSVLLKEIKQHFGQEEACTLEGAGFRTDGELKSLTRQDLHELFPGPNKLKMRREIFEMIHKQKPISKVLKDLTGFIPHDELRSALTNSGVLVDYLHILKDIKSQVNNVQLFLEAHIDLLENMRNPQTDTEPGQGASDSAPEVEPCISRGAGQPQEAQVSSVVKYKKIICGRTFLADKQLMDLVSKSNSAQFVEDQPDSQVNIVFCPISSREGSDVDAAMAKVADDKPVILVLMHHTHEAKYTSSVKPWLPDHRDVFPVDIFYHETANGLLRCDQNHQAVSKIQAELQKHISTKHSVSADTKVETSGNNLPSFFNIFNKK
ncbi:hypothetical protein INR49_032033 [Caranx melampygus]|nr:hypothetical protein INR49_032033 [Caranx melampygus]